VHGLNVSEIINELKRAWKEAVVAYFMASYIYSLLRTEEDQSRPVRIGGVTVEVRTGYFPNTSHKCYSLEQLARCIHVTHNM